jgi:hypothetical protein
MAEFLARRVFSARRLFTRRVVVIAAVVVIGGLVAGGAALVTSGDHGSAASPAGDASVPTAAVVRTDLISTVQDGGSIGYGGSYTVAAPSGTSPSQVSQAQQAVAEDQQALSADEQAGSDASAAGSQQIATDQANVRTDQSTLSSDQAQETKACAGAGASGQACSQDTQKVSSDQGQLTQAQQELASAQTSARQQDDQDQAKLSSDQVKLQGDESSLATDQAAAVNPGTTYTWLPQPGQVIRQDQPVYKVSNEPVPLLYGSIPAYRAFYPGMSDGGDVGELTHDLIALGYGVGLAQSNHYSSATAAAVQRWQTALGLPATGEVLLGEVVFEPGPIRITSVTPSVGTTVGGGAGGGSGGGGSVLTASGITPVVTVELAVTQEYMVKPGDAVSVVLPDGTTTVNGQIETVGNVATCPGSGGVGSGSGASTAGGSADQSPCSSGGSGGGGGSNSSATVTVTISLDSAPAQATLDQAPVNVNITEQQADNVLAVPVNALLALASGGYAVQVVTGPGASHLVAVTTGLYSSTLVQVSGPGIAAGMRVQVPSS